MKPGFKKVIIPLFLVIIASIFIHLILIKGEKAKFYRVELNQPQGERESSFFKVNRSLGKISFIKGDHQFHLEDISSLKGYYFYLRGKRQVKIIPKFSGKVKFYTHLYFKSLDKNSNIQFNFDLYRDENIQNIANMVATTMSTPYFIHLELQKNDILLLKFSGRGVVYFSKPLIYKAVESNQRRNIILVGIDTLRGDQIGIKKGDVPLTPHIQKFIKDSVTFENAYAQTSWTLPSFMSLFTGLYEYNHQVGTRQSLSMDKPFLVENISSKFITFGIHGGKVMKRRWGYSRGFDYYKHYRPAGALFPDGGKSLFDKAIEILDKSDFPDLFLFLHTYQVHAPYRPPERFLFKINKNPKFKKLEAVNYNNPAKTYLPVEEELKTSLKDLYQTEILAFDAYFGEFIDRLKKMNLYNNSMIILMSDHGEEFFEHRGWAHSHSLYDELIKVPMIIKFPGNLYRSSRIINAVGIIDLIPTVLDFYNISYDIEALDGRSLMSVVKNGKERVPDHIISTISTGRYFEAIPPKIAIISDQYKLIYNFPFSNKDLNFFKEFSFPPEVPEYELFDLKKDPLELHNIISQGVTYKNKMSPVMQKLKIFIQKKMFEARKNKKPLDKEVEQTLKSLGYL